MPKSETEIQDENIYAALLANIEEALQNNPRAAHAFAALMWLVGDAWGGPVSADSSVA
jgi:hypothetical protein